VFDIRAEGLTRDDWLDLLMTHMIQPTIPANRVLMVYDYPKSQAALARIRQGDVPVAERFEVYLGPIELANGYRELNDPEEQRERFERDLSRAQKRGRAAAVDERLLAALPAMPDCSGVALGVDRLLLAMLGSDAWPTRSHFPSTAPERISRGDFDAVAPARLAAYSAASACASRSAGSRRAREQREPMEVVSFRQAAGLRAARPWRPACRISSERAAQRHFAPISGRITRNSSPPWRQAMSSLREVRLQHTREASAGWRRRPRARSCR
jgi:hypothetical protein